MLTNISKKYLFVEFILFFLVIPIVLALPVPVVFKIFPVVTGFTYVLFVLYQYTGFKISWPDARARASFFKSFIPRFLLILVLGYWYIYLTSPDQLFGVVIDNPRLWLVILFVYTFGSVLPQELIYRTFFFHRYRKIIPHEFWFILINALVFSLSHMFLKSWFVLLITFFGGLMFALSYRKTNSTWLVILEHAAYGLWLFTVGIGQTLAFPG